MTRRGDVDFGILFPKGEADAELELCGDKSDRKNTIGCIFFFGRAPISWSSTKEPVVALSSCEIEYIAASGTACQSGTMLKTMYICRIIIFFLYAYRILEFGG
ncbi:Retrovirus-related Pol polyprotein from transposon TNT 1-94 [Glycine soja]